MHVNSLPERISVIVETPRLQNDRAVLCPQVHELRRGISGKVGGIEGLGEGQSTGGLKVEVQGGRFLLATKPPGGSIAPRKIEPAEGVGPEQGRIAAVEDAGRVPQYASPAA